MSHPEASTYRLLIVALLQRGHPMTLLEVAQRFAQAGPHQAGVGAVVPVLRL